MLDLIYPPRCLVCDEAGPETLCAECRAAIGADQDEPPTSPPGIEAVASLGPYRGVLREAVLSLKHRRSLARPLGNLLARRLELVLAEWWPDAVIPVPIHWWNRCRRGYNQSELLVHEIAARLELRADTGSLAQVRRTRSQVGLPDADRWRNRREAFEVVGPGSLAGLSVLLVDDVLTTGATLAECAAALRRAGVREVYSLVLAARPTAPAPAAVSQARVSPAVSSVSSR